MSTQAGRPDTTALPEGAFFATLRTRVARILDQGAERLERSAEHSARTGETSARLAAGLRSGARTLEAVEGERLVDSAADAVRRSPAVALGAAFAVGFVVGRLLRR